MGSSVGDLEVAMRVLCTDKVHLKDSAIAPLGWHFAAAEAALRKPQLVKIGMLAESHLLPVSPSVKRALQMAKDALVADGFQVVDIALPK